MQSIWNRVFHADSSMSRTNAETRTREDEKMRRWMYIYILFLKIQSSTIPSPTLQLSYMKFTEHAPRWVWRKKGRELGGNPSASERCGTKRQTSVTNSSISDFPYSIPSESRLDIPRCDGKFAFSLTVRPFPPETTHLPNRDRVYVWGVSNHQPSSCVLRCCLLLFLSEFSTTLPFSGTTLLVASIPDQVFGNQKHIVKVGDSRLRPLAHFIHFSRVWGSNAYSIS